jgi:hypothetical protein
VGLRLDQGARALHLRATSGQGGGWSRRGRPHARWRARGRERIASRARALFPRFFRARVRRFRTPLAILARSTACCWSTPNTSLGGTRTGRS